LGATFGHFLVGLIAVVAFVLYPRMLERYGETNDIESLREMTVISSFFVSFITAMFVSMGIIIIPVFLRFFLPAYLPAVKTVKIFLLAVYFLSFSPIMGNCLISINHQRKIIVTQIAAFLLCLTTDYLLIKKGLGINYIAVGTGFSFFLYSTALAYAAFASFFKGRLQIIKEIARIYLPFAANILCLFVLISMFRLPFALFCYNLFALLLVQILFCLVVNGYILVYLNKRYKILARLLPVGLQK